MKVDRPIDWCTDAVLAATSICRASVAGVFLVEGAVLAMHTDTHLAPDVETELLDLCERTIDTDNLTVVHFHRSSRRAGRGQGHSFVGIPIRADNKLLIGVLFVADAARVRIDHDDREALWALGRLAGRELASRRMVLATTLVNRVASVAHRSTDLAGALRVCLDEVCRFADWPVGHVYMSAGDDRGELVSSGIWHCADESRYVRLRDVTGWPLQGRGAALVAKAAIEKSPQWMDEPEVAEETAGDSAIRGGFAFPVHANGELVAILAFFDCDRRSPSPRLAELVDVLDAELGMAAARIRDRAELVRGQVALGDTVRQLRQVIATAHDAFIALDTSGLVTEWNTAATTVFGWSREEMLGRPLVDTIIPVRYREAHRAGVARLRTNGQGTVLNRQVELAALHKDGREFPIELFVWEPQTNGPYRFNAFIRDISERKQAERALRDAYLREQEVVEELRRFDRIKTDFVANVSHELRTPLTSISGYLELLVDGVAGELTEQQCAMAAIVQRNTQRLLRLVEDILTVGKMDSGEFQPVLVPTTLAPLVRVAVQSLRPAAESKSLNLTLEIESESDTVLADPNQLDRALLNLVTNAVKFTPSGGSIAIGVDSDADEARITVADTGIGIPEDELPRLFSRFFRSSLATEREIQGTGLGLTIVKHIVETHRGRISVQSQPAIGTTVTVVLPVVHPV